jgi:DNA primase large subunit
MQAVYADQLAGKKLHYMARLALASFLHKLGMSKDELLILFSKSPDYKKSVAEYHIDRIISSDLSSPGCKKLWDYGLRVAACEKECKFKHPLQWYIAKLRIRNQKKNSSVKEKTGETQ